MAAVVLVNYVPVKQKIRPVAGVNLLRVPDPVICAPLTTQTAALPHRQTSLSTMFHPHGRGILTPSRNCGIAGVSASNAAVLLRSRSLCRSSALKTGKGSRKNPWNMAGDVRGRQGGICQVGARGESKFSRASCDWGSLRMLEESAFLPHRGTELDCQAVLLVFPADMRRRSDIKRAAFNGFRWPSPRSRCDLALASESMASVRLGVSEAVWRSSLEDSVPR